MNTLQWSRTVPLLLLLAASLQAIAHAQEVVDTPEEIVRAYFDGKNYALNMASGTCPGDDALNDAIVAEFIRPRSEVQTRRMAKSWSHVPACRADQILDWYDGAIRIVTDALDAAAVARNVIRIDETAGLRLLRRAAADASVPDEARGAYQTAVYYKLSRAEQEELFLETFRQELQVGWYRRSGMRHLFGPPDPTGRAIRILAEVVEYPDNDQAPHILGAILSTSVNLGGFGPEGRQRIWDFLEPHLSSLPPEMRSAVESYEADLNRGAG